MSEYRTPEERRAEAEQRDRVAAVLDRAVQDMVSCKLAMTYGEHPDVVDAWVDRVFNGLREGLSDDRDTVAGMRMEDRLTAIVMLLEDRAGQRCQSVLTAAADIETTEG